MAPLLGVELSVNALRVSASGLTRGILKRLHL